jgi:hypothetical protein
MRALDRAQRPVPGIHVTLRSDARPQTGDHRATGAEGEVAYEDLAPGPYHALGAWRVGAAEGTFDGVRFRLDPGERRIVTFTERSRVADLALRFRGVRIADASLATVLWRSPSGFEFRTAMGSREGIFGLDVPALPAIAHWSRSVEDLPPRSESYLARLDGSSLGSGLTEVDALDGEIQVRCDGPPHARPQSLRVHEFDGVPLLTPARRPAEPGQGDIVRFRGVPFPSVVILNGLAEDGTPVLRRLEVGTAQMRIDW